MIRIPKIKDVRYQDVLARKRRRLLVFRTILFGFLALVFVGGSGYVFFFTKAFEVKNISVKGLETIDSQSIRAKIEQSMQKKALKYFKLNQNILLFKTANLNSQFLSEFPKLKSVSSAKHYFHEVEFDFKERKPLGVWCTILECNYFDSDGQTWGPAIRSSGFLFLAIDDQRVNAGKLDHEFLKGIKEVIELLPIINLSVKTVAIPADSFRDLRVYTDKNYYLIISLDTNMEKQIKVLKVLLDEKSDRLFRPAYIDLRLDGRIYYR